MPMSASPDEERPQPEYPDSSVAGVEAVAEQLIALVEEFEAQLTEGHVPPCVRGAPLPTSRSRRTTNLMNAVAAFHPLQTLA